MTYRYMPLRRSVRLRQGGTSLIEILVGMVIALFMLSALLMVFLNMRQSYTDQDSLAQLQDNERLALTVFTDIVQLAGYFPSPLTSTELSSLPALNASYATLAAGQSIAGTTGAAGASDTLTVRFVTGNGDGTINCQGQTNTSGANASYVNVFAVNASQQLTCAVSGGSPAVLASGVTAFNVLYGTDTDNDGNVDQYLTATAVTNGSYWAQVSTVRVTVTFANPYASQPGQPATVSWTQTISLMNRV